MRVSGVDLTGVLVLNEDYSNIMFVHAVDTSVDLVFCAILCFSDIKGEFKASCGACRQVMAEVSTVQCAIVLVTTKLHVSYTMQLIPVITIVNSEKYSFFILYCP